MGLTAIEIEKSSKVSNIVSLDDVNYTFAYILMELKGSVDRLTESINVLTTRLTRR